MNESTSASGADFDLTQFYQVFFEEASENLGQMESLLLDLDIANPDDEQMNAIFRCAHSIKGGAATFGFQDVADLTHVMETLLDRLRRHEIRLRSEMVDVLLESRDTLQSLLDRHAGTSTQVVDSTGLVARIGALVNGGPAPAAAVAHPVPVTVATVTPARTPEETTRVTPVSQAQAAQAIQANPVKQRKGGKATGQAGERELELLIGPLSNDAVLDSVVELFDDITGLGLCETAHASGLSAGRYRFRVVTTSSDNDLMDLFGFHVDRDVLAIRPWSDAQASAAPSASVSGVSLHVPESEGYGFFVDVPGQALNGDATVVGVASEAALEAASEAVSGPASIEAVNSAAAAAGSQPAATAPVPATTVDESSRPARARPEKAAASSGDASTIRVSVEKVDQLINLVGELVITQAMLAQTGRTLDPVVNQQMLSSLGDLERNTRMLQESVMAIRMIPMAVVFNRFPRMLRDLAGKLGKQVDLHQIGEATELDKGMVEKITDPLTHLVRNAVDHGIETPEKRIAAGKPAQGTVTLSAEHRGGSIVIEVRDDGRGLSRTKLLQKAVERGLPCSETMTDQEVYNLIFEPGFSTADQVTDISGRGVGMDVVKRNILGLGGSVELDSAEGLGTRVSVRLPLTLAIMDGMSVGVGDETFILPLASVTESIQLDQKLVRSLAGSERIIQVREEYLPVLVLEEFFGMGTHRQSLSDGDDSSILVVVESDGLRAAVLVDRLIGQHQVVVKNLEANYRKVEGVAGATILGDGHVALILDIGHMVRRVRN